MWRHRLLRIRQEEGSAVVESVFAIIFLMLLALGTIEVAFALYGRNVVLSAAHEGARAAVEVGRTPDEAEAIAIDTVRNAAGGLVDDLRVDVASSAGEGVRSVQVTVAGHLSLLGPLPFTVPITAHSSATHGGIPE